MREEEIIKQPKYSRRVLGLGICERVDPECGFGYVEVEKPSRNSKDVSQTIGYHSLEPRRSLSLS